GLGIDEARDQPGARDAVDLRPLAGHPARRGARGLLVERVAAPSPRFDAALEIGRLDTAAREHLRRALAHLAPVCAVDDDARGPGKLIGPARDRLWIAPERSRQLVARGQVGLLAPDIDEERSLCRTQGRPEFVLGYHLRHGHRCRLDVSTRNLWTRLRI